MNDGANLKVKIGADIAEIKSALTDLRGSIKKTQADANGLDFKNVIGGLKGFLGAVGGLSLVSMGLTKIYENTVAAERAQAQLNAVLKSTGGAAGLVSGELNKMAEGFQAITTYDDEAITGAQALLLTFTNVGRDVFPQATRAILDMSTALGQDLTSSTTLVGKALNDPIKGLTALTRVGVSFSAQQKELIKDLAESGRVAEAQVEILKELERQYGGSAEAARNTLGGAIQGLKNDFDNLLEGDTGDAGIRGATNAINDLARTMRSPETKLAMAELTSDVAGLTSELAKFYLLSRKVGGVAPLTGALSLNIGSLPTAIPGFLAYLSRPEVRDKTAVRGGTPMGYGRTFVPAPPEGETEEQRREREQREKEAEAEAKRKRAADAAERKREDDRREAEEKARNKRIADGLFDVNNALLTATGQDAQAAFNEIEAKYAQLIADLKAAGKDEEILKVEQLINVEKAAAQLDIFKDKVSSINAELRDEESRLADQVTSGSISQLEAERRINDARDVALGKMRQLQAAVEAYLATLDPNSPEGQRALEFYRKLGIEIDKTRQQQNTMAQEAKDIAENAFAGLFEDLITGAKSAKSAFEDFVKAFVRGIARMIAERLAQIVVERLFNAILGVNGQAAMASGGAVGGFVLHSGGVVGSGGMLRNVDPALFANAPRYHSGGIAGLRPGEVPAILERGELVIPKNAVGKGGGGNVSVIVENKSGAQARTEESMVGSDKVIRVIIDAARNAVANDIARGGTTLNKAMEGRYGVNPQGVTRG